MTDQLPAVSVIIPARNEQTHLPACLDSLLAQTYPSERLEILVVDGRSSDSTAAIAADYCLRFPHIRLLENPRRIVSTALNLGLRQAGGSVIVRIDAHCVVAPDYVAQCVDHLLHADADNVGGTMQAFGKTAIAKAIAIGTSCPFGVGDARFHYSRAVEYVDTVYLGAYRREVFEKLGEFDEGLVRNQDDEFNYRLRAAGGRVLLSPAIKSCYCCRSNLGGLFSQYFQYGFWKVRVLQKHRRQMRPRQFAPAAFIAALVASALLGALSIYGAIAFAALTGIYLLGLTVATVGASRGGDWKSALLLPAVFPTMHFGYGLGFLAGLVRFRGFWGLP